MHETELDRRRIALGVRQPWAELILSGIKSVEVRSTGTKQRGTIYIYASRMPAQTDIARVAVDRFGLEMDALPRGVLVGTVDLIGSGPATADDATKACVPKEYLSDRFAWALANPKRLEQTIAPAFLPYGVWFYPFRRKNQSRG